MDQRELLLAGEPLTEAGIRLALERDKIKNDWTKKAFELLQEFIPVQKQFMCEEFRNYCRSRGLALPSSNRAFGGIILKAMRKGLIRRVGYGRVKNPKAHAANATVWQTCIQPATSN